MIKLAAALLACAALPALAQAPAQAPDQAPVAPDADRPGKTPAGTVFTAPKAWTLRTAGGWAELAPPERDLAVAIVDVGVAADARAAIDIAWKTYAPAKLRAPKLISALSAREGWEERQWAEYENSPNERRVTGAMAMRRGKAWTVMILDGAEQTLEKRGAAAVLVRDSVRPAGYARESFAGRTPLPMTPERIAALRSFVADAIRQLEVPGAAFALTDRKRTFYATGVGVRELGKPEAVDGDTQFMIASNTKGMATLLLAKLADEGKLRWDQQVTQVYPTFRLGSPETTSKVLVRHLVCACTGLPRKDMQWLLNTSADTPASDTFVQLAATQPTSGFGEVFQYNNLMASAAGYIGGHLAHPDMELGRAFDAAMQEKIFVPLGMTATGFDSARAMAGNWARPHAFDIDGRTVASLKEGMRLNEAVMPYRPAGGAWSSANDLIKYVRFELNEGKLDDGRQWVKAANLIERRKPGVPSGEDEFYGMGLEQNRQWGVPVVHHGGSLGGYKTDILFIPEAGIGAVILTNADQGQSLLTPFLRRLLELLYDGKPEAAATITASAARYKVLNAKERELVTLPADPAAVAALASAYANPDLGRIEVIKGREPTFRFTSFSTPVATRRNPDGTTSFVTLEPTVLGIPLVMAEGGKQLVVRDGQHEYRFEAVR